MRKVRGSERIATVSAAVAAFAAAFGAFAAAVALIYQIHNFNSEREQRISGEKALLGVLMDRVDRDLNARFGQDLMSKSKSELQADKRRLPWAPAEQRLYEELVSVVRQKDRIGKESLLIDLTAALEGESSEPMMSASDAFEIRNEIKKNKDALN
jgi:hypothetical protein